jgi:outer membrane immunogenic protein
MRKALLASVSAVALGCSAAMPVQAAPPVPTWTGFYVGVNAGSAWGNSDPSLIGSFISPFNYTGTNGSSPSLSPRGFIGGGQAGYNWQTGQWVFGGEIDFSGLDAKADASVSPFFLGKATNRVTSWSSRYDWLFTARLRGGFLIAPSWLLYATGGLAVTHARDSVTAFFPLGQTDWADSKTLVGGTIGGGIETMFAPGWTARVEYLYAKFKDTTADNVEIPNAPLQFSFHHDLNVVRFAINYKFGP